VARPPERHQARGLVAAEPLPVVARSYRISASR